MRQNLYDKVQPSQMPCSNDYCAEHSLYVSPKWHILVYHYFRSSFIGVEYKDIDQMSITYEPQIVDEFAFSQLCGEIHDLISLERDQKPAFLPLDRENTIDLPHLIRILCVIHKACAGKQVIDLATEVTTPYDAALQQLIPPESTLHEILGFSAGEIVFVICLCDF